MMFWIAALVLPIAGALQSYSVDYGYRGLSHEAALDRAVKAASVLAMFSVTCALAHWGLQS